MVLGQVLPQLSPGQGDLALLALRDVESVDGLEVDGEDPGGTELLLTVTADVALMAVFMLADCLGAKVAAELPQAGDLPGALTLAELVVVVSDEV